MSSKSKQLSGYGTVTVVDETSTQNFNESTGSWVEANVILPANVIDEKNTEGEQQESSVLFVTKEEISGARAGARAGAGSAKRPPVFRDVGFALLFLAHLATFTFVGISYGGCSTEDSDQITSTNNNDGGTEVQSSLRFMTILLATNAVLAFVVTNFITSSILPNFPTLAIQASLYGSLVIYTSLGFFIFISHANLWTFLILIALFGLNFWYLFAVQSFIPFASTNLKLASRAISTNFGIYFVAFLVGIIGVGWVCFWTYTATGLGIFTDITTTASESNDEYYDSYGASITNEILGMKGFALLLSLYWTINVLVNIIQTTTAGVTGTWCFDNTDASSYCSSAVTQSLFRSCTYSLGSICFGSLLTALVTTMRVVIQWARDRSRHDDNSGAAILYCILSCILSLIEDIVEYFNQWAYIFVGIWGLDYLESGKRVLQLFEARGCTAIISNGLASYVLTNVVVFTSLVCGIFGYIFGGDGGSFFACLFVGLIVSAIMIATVQGAVKAVMVCYVDHPHKLHENHPEETLELVRGIEKAFPTVVIPVFIDTMV